MDIFKELKKKKIYMEDDLHKEIDGYLNDPNTDKELKEALSKFKSFLSDIRNKKPNDIEWKIISKEEVRKYYQIIRNLKSPHYHDNILPKLKEIGGVKRTILRWL